MNELVVCASFLMPNRWWNVEMGGCFGKYAGWQVDRQVGRGRGTWVSGLMSQVLYTCTEESGGKEV